jgi:hypothetical protein
MSRPHEIRIALERDYRLALGEYERAEMPTETIVGLKALAESDRRIQAQKKVLREKMKHLNYLLRLQVDPEWTPYHLTPLHPRKTRRKGSVAKAAYQALKAFKEPMTTREISKAIAGGLEIDASDQRAVNQLDNAVRTSMKARVEDDSVVEIEGRPTRWQVVSRSKWAPTPSPYASASAPLVRAAGLSRAHARAAPASNPQVRHQG